MKIARGLLTFIHSITYEPSREGTNLRVVYEADKFKLILRNFPKVGDSIF